ncbi:MAG: intradiol ring-cleavage dioxygenase [Burkholderiales bacterium]|jgi:protocatechuate 3,4-dioxygenase beta subunit
MTISRPDTADSAVAPLTPVTGPTSSDRRALCLSGAILACVPGAARSRPGTEPTPSQMEGPYYPVEPIPVRSRLRELDGRRAQGTGLLLSGQVWSEGRPVPDARVEIWQCDARGIYRHPAQRGEPDPGFAGYGAQVTDAEGRWAFDTLMPVPYEGRPPHIHLRVKRAGRMVLTSQLYLEGRTEESGFLRRVPGLQGPRERLTLRPDAGGPGREPSATFDIVLG